MTRTRRDRAGNGLPDPRDPQGRPLATPLDRRWLWHVESWLAGAPTSDMLRQLGTDLGENPAGDVRAP